MGLFVKKLKNHCCIIELELSTKVNILVVCLLKLKWFLWKN